MPESTICRCGQPVVVVNAGEFCRECWAVEIDRRMTELRAKHPNIGRRSPGLRDRRYGGY